MEAECRIVLYLLTTESTVMIEMWVIYHRQHWNSLAGRAHVRTSFQNSAFAGGCLAQTSGLIYLFIIYLFIIYLLFIIYVLLFIYYLFIIYVFIYLFN